MSDALGCRLPGCICRPALGCRWRGCICRPAPDADRRIGQTWGGGQAEAHTADTAPRHLKEV